MSSTEKTPPCPQNSQDPLRPTVPARQQDPSLCPSWCDGEHLRETPDLGGDFHHDGEPTSVFLEHSTTEVDQLFVKPSQFVPGDGPADRPFVELLNERCLVGLMTADEAVDLASALIVAASQARAL